MTKPLRIIPLGGLGEVGKNIMVVECGDDAVVIDAGLMFPKQDMHGVDLVLADTSYLTENKDRVRAILITHGHEDHIGGLPYLLRDVQAPIYAPPLAKDLITVKLKEHIGLDKIEVHAVSPGDAITLGAITAEYFRVCHSIPDACGIALRTPAGIVVHSGDFKIDHTPVDGKTTELHRLAELGNEGVLLLLSDSTYAESPGYTPSEQVVSDALDVVIGRSQGRVLLATFASLIARVQQVADVATKHGRHVALAGRSMVGNVNMALQKGYIKVPPGTFVSMEELNGLPPEQQLVMLTGAQGEPFSVLARVARRQSRDITIRDGDTVIISATAIPGNETAISGVIDNLTRQGANVITRRHSPVHVQGHASQEELKLMLNLIRPKFFVPIHGEYRMLRAHADLAETVGINSSNITVMEDGDVLEIVEDQASLVERLPSGHVYVDGLRLWDVRSPVLRERKRLATDGFVVAVIPLDNESGELLGDPEIVTNGFIELEDSTDLIDHAVTLLSEALRKDEASLFEEGYITSRCKEILGPLFQRETGRRPFIVSLPIEV